MRTKVQRLPVEAISQASANQRSGRCGRLGPGIAIRLYSEEDFEGRPEFTDPEILRTNLASVILQMASLGLGDMARFPFVEPPDRRNVTAGVQLLEELGALRDGDGSPRSAGGWPGCRSTRGWRGWCSRPSGCGCVREVIVIAAALSLQDPRERPAELQAQADQQHARFKAEGSDFLTWLNLWRYLKEQQRELSSSAFRRMCKREFLNYLRVREWQDFESQLRQVCKEMEIKARAARRRTSTPTASTRRCWPGCSSTSGCSRSATARSRLGRGRPREYLGARGARFAIFPGSGLHRKNPQFLMAGELVETSRLWARQNAAIKPEWAEELGAHLVKRTLLRAALVEEARLGDGPRAGHAVRRTAGRRPAGGLRQGRRRAVARAVHPARAGLRRVEHAGTASSTPTGGCSRRPRSSSTAPGAATSWSTSTRSSTSTTRGSARRW